MRRWPLALLAVLLVVVCAAAARAADPAAEATAPARIVSLAPSVTETLFALGVGARVVAVSDFCDYPPEVAKLPRIGSFLSPSVEVVVGLRPDLVIGTESPGNHDAVLMLRRLGVRVEILEALHLSELGPVTGRMAELVGARAAGERLVAKMERDVAAVRARVEGAPRPRVLMTVGRDPLVAAGPRSLLGELLEAAGGTNVAPAGEAWPHLNVEYVVAADPEVVIDTSMGTEEGSTPEFWRQLASLAAVRTNRVHAFRSYRILRPGPRLPEALADLARIVHPER